MNSVSYDFCIHNDFYHVKFLICNYYCADEDKFPCTCTLDNKLFVFVFVFVFMKHSDELDILSDTQHGLRKNRSCETQLLATSHEIDSLLSSDSQVDVILLDFSKAFDKVPHARLLQKLSYYGVRSNTLSLPIQFVDFEPAFCLYFF